MLQDVRLILGVGITGRHRGLPSLLLLLIWHVLSFLCAGIDDTSMKRQCDSPSRQLTFNGSSTSRYIQAEDNLQGCFDTPNATGSIIVNSSKKPVTMTVTMSQSQSIQ